MRPISALEATLVFIDTVSIPHNAEDCTVRGKAQLHCIFIIRIYSDINIWAEGVVGGARSAMPSELLPYGRFSGVSCHLAGYSYVGDGYRSCIRPG